MGNGTVSVIDANTLQRLRSRGLHAARRADPRRRWQRGTRDQLRHTHTVYVANGGDNTVSVIDAGSCNAAPRSSAAIRRRQPSRSAKNPRRVAHRQVDQHDLRQQLRRRRPATRSRVIDGSRCDATTDDRVRTGARHDHGRSAPRRDSSSTRPRIRSTSPTRPSTPPPRQPLGRRHRNLQRRTTRSVVDRRRRRSPQPSARARSRSIPPTTPFTPPTSATPPPRSSPAPSATRSITVRLRRPRTARGGRRRPDRRRARHNHRHGLRRRRRRRAPGHIDTRHRLRLQEPVITAARSPRIEIHRPHRRRRRSNHAHSLSPSATPPHRIRTRRWRR